MFNLRYTKTKFWKFLGWCPWRHPPKLCLQGRAGKEGHFLLSIDLFDQKKLVSCLCCPTWLKTNNSKAKLHPSLPQHKAINIHESFFPIKSLVHFNVRITLFNHCFTILSEILSSFTMLSFHSTAYGLEKL